MKQAAGRAQMTGEERSAGTKIAILSIALGGIFLLSFVLGRYRVPLAQVLRILTDELLRLLSRGAGGLEQTWTDNMGIVVLNIRLPRILLACSVGCSLSAAGAAYQGVFQNPMAAPDILGASSGAAFGAALAIYLGCSGMGVTLSAFALGMASVCLVYLVSRCTRGSQVVNIILAGVMVSSLFSAATSYIKLVADPTDQLPAITYWLMGSLAGARLGQLAIAALPMMLGLLPLFLLRWRINILTLGDEEARSMGVNPGRLRFLLLLCATFITAASVAASGMIGWVGLVVPHLCRKLVGSNYKHLLPASMLFGAAFLLLVDNISRNLLATEIPIGILTAFVGAPFFLHLMTKKQGGL